MTDQTTVDPDDDKIVDPPEGDDAQDNAPSAEDRAMAMGWTPKGQFKGDPEKWVDAETFIKRGEEFLPFLKANNKRLERELETLKKSMKEFGEFHSRTEQRAYERAIQDLEARQAEAVAAGDADAVREITKDMVALNKDVAKAAPDEAPELTAWKAENPWFEKSSVMRGAAIEIVNELIAEGTTNLKAQLREVDRRIREEFPAKFENPRRREPGAVESADRPARKAGKTRSDLPPQARETMDRWIKQGLITEAAYLKDYQW